MSGREDFLAAIRVADPEDDAATLIYADWLEEQGDIPAAEIIRVQVELERGELRHGHEERRGLLERERDLLKQYEGAWKGEMSESVGWPGNRESRTAEWGPFRRGLVRSANFRLSILPDRAVVAPDYARIFRATAVTNLSFDGSGLVDFLKREIRTEATGLAINGVLGLGQSPEEAYKILAEMAGLPRLAMLDLRSQGIGNAGLKALKPAPWFGAIRELNLRANRLTATAVSSLPDSLQDLWLGMNLFSKDGVRVLAGRRFFGRLRSLELCFLDLDAEAAELIAHGLRDGGLRRLNLRSNLIGDEGLIALLRSGALENVTDLDVNFNRITDRGARELIRSGSLPAWIRLNIGVNDLGPGTKRELSERFGDQVIA